jgi:hypothetical protein
VKPEAKDISNLFFKTGTAKFLHEIRKEKSKDTLQLVGKLLLPLLTDSPSTQSSHTWQASTSGKMTHI